ncbi:MAG: CPBP family intramembrane metalloprotease [Chloroflexi bacterium]|nr:MAG: CPBP family intramembrane metalloprotease [Chloroflexota bacterium]
MQFIKAVFWNAEQRRVRALWRLIGQIILLMTIALPLETVVGFVAFGALLAHEGIGPDQLADPHVMDTLSPERVQEFINRSPALMMLSVLALMVAFPLSVWLAGRFLDRRPFADFGFHLNKNWWGDFGFGLLQGALLMVLIFVIELAAGWVTIRGTFVTRNPDTTFATAMLPPLLTFLAVGFYEELFSRGYQLQNMAEGLNWRAIGPRWAIALATLLSSAVFGILHAGNPNASFVSTVNLFLAGIHLALGFLLTGELAIPIGLHITWNFFQGNVFGFPVSGADYRSATFIAIEQSGPAVWTGGAFGPEAGLVGLGAMAVGGLLTVLWVRWRYGRVELHTTLAEPPERSQPT